MEFSKSLKLNHLFRRLYSKGKSCANGYLVIYCRKNGTQENRIGLTVSAKLGHAVVRNKIRRRLREIYRLHEQQFKPGWDIVVVARGRAVQASYHKLEKSYLHLAEKLELLHETDPS
ncbi:MAG: ribonuclease P protein component [Oscillospiraceae bacterium]|nr:ribonuclease P protein component [Oscillospiraceae bacterium]